MRLLWVTFNVQMARIKQTLAMGFSLIVFVNLRILSTFIQDSVFAKEVNGRVCQFGKRLKLNLEKISVYMYGSKLVELT